jgi:hypothetical protein
MFPPFSLSCTQEYFLEKYPDEYVKNKWKENVIKSFHGAGSARALHLSERVTK